MINERLPGLFITGTDTDVGKTWVTAAIARCLLESGYKVGVIKPLATGIKERFAEESDAVMLLRNAGWPVNETTLNLANPVWFEAAAAPTVAARAEGRRLEWSEVHQQTRASIEGWRQQGAQLILVEGVGGLECPLAEPQKTVRDLVLDIDYPAVVIARRGLGTLNHTISTIKLLKQGPTRIVGVILNQVPGDQADGIPESTAALELSIQIASVSVLHDGKAAENPAMLASQIRHLDWHARCLKPRWNDVFK